MAKNAETVETPETTSEEKEAWTISIPKPRLPKINAKDSAKKAALYVVPAALAGALGAVVLVDKDGNELFSSNSEESSEIDLDFDPETSTD